MKLSRGGTSRDALLAAGVDLFRQQGFAGTSVESVCRAAGVTKGAFFHHFATKQKLAEACLQRWDAQASLAAAQAPWRALEDPVDRLVGCLDGHYGRLSGPASRRASLAGAVSLECGETQPGLRDGARACFDNDIRRLAGLIEEAADSCEVVVDARSLARFWVATVQGALLVGRASSQDAVIPDCLAHAREHLLAAVTGTA